MTKINKIGKSSFVIAILSFLLVGVLAFGGTYAYFTAKTNTVSGSVQTGHLNIGSVAASETGVVNTDTLAINGTVVVPNETLINTVFSADVTSNISFFSRVKFSVSIDVKADDVKGGEGADKDDPTADALTHKHYAGTETECKDYVDKAIKALIVKLNGDAITTGSISNAAATAFTTSAVSWVEGETTSESSATQTTAYFYNLAPYAVTPGAENANKTTTVYFPAYIQVEDFLGRAMEDDATRCPYWMDATISISISFEVMQAEHIDGAVLDDATGAFKATDGGNSALQNAEAAWDTALSTTNGVVAG